MKILSEPIVYPRLVLKLPSSLPLIPRARGMAHSHPPFRRWYLPRLTRSGAGAAEALRLSLGRAGWQLSLAARARTQWQPPAGRGATAKHPA